MGATAFDQTPSPQSAANLAGLIPANNALINSDFRINQRVYVSAAALAAGAYGHDRWKAGAAGGDYSFTQLASSTTVTIASGKSLIQVVEDKNVEGGSYVLSWTGTALGRVGINSATPSGAYAASPILITGQTAGTTMSVELGPGTVGKVKLETGSVPTPFVMSDITSELQKAYRYGEMQGRGFAGVAFSTTGASIVQAFKARKRVVPQSTLITGANALAIPGAGSFSISSFATTSNDVDGSYLVCNSAGLTTGAFVLVNVPNFVFQDAEL